MNNICDIKKKKNNKYVFQTIRKYSEYIWIIFALLETNSLFVVSIENNSSKVQAVVVVAACFLLVGMIICLFCENNALIQESKLFLPLICGLFILVGVFGLLNARKQGIQFSDYIIRFCIFLPLASVFFFLKRKSGEFIDIWVKFSNIVFTFAIINLVLYLCVLINPNALTANVIQTAWSGSGVVRYLCNYYNFCVVENGLGKCFFDVFFPRNMGIYPEPLMYVIPLIVSLYTEIFLQGEKRQGLLRSIIYSIVIITSQSTLGVMLAFAAWILIVIKHYRRKFTEKNVLIFFCIFCMGCLGLLISKYLQTPNSFYDHVQDYIFAVKAFLNKPLVGGGYGNEEYIRSFMTQERLITNSGLSNSIAVVLAEGGILLGGICIIPFIIGIVQIVNKRCKLNQNIAFWTVGSLGLYCVTIFHFHMILLMMMAFGYSLLEFRREENKWMLSIWPEETCMEMEYNKRIYSSKRIGKRISIASVFTIILFCATPVWTILYNVMQENQLLIGDHVWYWIFLLMVVTFILVYLKQQPVVRFGKRNLIIYTILFVVFYAKIYSWVHTALVWKKIYGEGREAILIVCVYFFGVVVLHIAYCLNARTKVYIIFGTLVIIGISGSVVYKKLDEHTYVVDSERKQLDKIVEVKKGKLYVEDTPVFYHHFYPTVRYAVGKAESFASKKNATILMPCQKNVQELFDNDYVATRISKQHILYSNDESVIESLKEEGYVFYHYYAYESLVNLKEQAALNNLKLNKENSCIVEGEKRSLIYGPYYRLDSGKYKVTYKLHVENVYEDMSICRVQVNAQYGQQNLASQEILGSMLDKNGNITIAIEFEVQQSGSIIEFLLFAYADNQIEIEKISYQKEYDYVTVTKYNGWHMEEFVKYYSTENDQAYAMDGEYFAIKKKYDRRNRRTEQSYYDEKLCMTNIDEGYAFVKYEYGTSSTTSYYFKKDGSNFTFDTGYSAERVEYLSDNKVKKVYLDAKGNVITLNLGYAEEQWITNSKGEEIERSYYDKSGKPVNCIWGYAKIIKEYNEQGLIIKRELLDAEDNPVDCIEGYQHKIWLYDENGNIVTIQFYDANGKMVREQKTDR